MTAERGALGSEALGAESAGAKSAGARFREALAEERPLQIVGAIHAYAALQARQAGFRALYLSGAGVSNASHGLPDLGWIRLPDVAEEARRILRVCDLPLLVDIDTGYGSLEALREAVTELAKIGVAAVHLEDQVDEKRCGHRPNKRVVAPAEMQERIGTAIEARGDSGLFVMARTDALAVEGFDAMLDRVRGYVAAGADGIFLEAMPDVEHYRTAARAIDVPVLANLTEFGRTPLLGLAELRDAGVAMALYPLSAFRAMSRAAMRTYRAIRGEGSQESVVEEMQTREELYETLDYLAQERAVDRSFDDARSQDEEAR